METFINLLAKAILVVAFTAIPLPLSATAAPLTTEELRYPAPTSPQEALCESLFKKTREVIAHINEAEKAGAHIAPLLVERLDRDSTLLHAPVVCVLYGPRITLEPNRAENPQDPDFDPTTPIAPPSVTDVIVKCLEQMANNSECHPDERAHYQFLANNLQCIKLLIVLHTGIKELHSFSLRGLDNLQGLVLEKNANLVYIDNKAFCLRSTYAGGQTPPLLYLRCSLMKNLEDRPAYGPDNRTTEEKEIHDLLQMLHPALAETLLHFDLHAPQRSIMVPCVGHLKHLRIFTVESKERLGFSQRLWNGDNGEGLPLAYVHYNTPRVDLYQEILLPRIEAGHHAVVHVTSKWKTSFGSDFVGSLEKANGSPLGGTITLDLQGCQLDFTPEYDEGKSQERLSKAHLAFASPTSHTIYSDKHTHESLRAQSLNQLAAEYGENVSTHLTGAPTDAQLQRAARAIGVAARERRNVCTTSPQTAALVRTTHIARKIGRNTLQLALATATSGYGGATAYQRHQPLAALLTASTALGIIYLLNRYDEHQEAAAETTEGFYGVLPGNTMPSLLCSRGESDLSATPDLNARYRAHARVYGAHITLLATCSILTLIRVLTEKRASLRSDCRVQTSLATQSELLRSIADETAGSLRPRTLADALRLKDAFAGSISPLSLARAVTSDTVYSTDEVEREAYNSEEFTTSWKSLDWPDDRTIPQERGRRWLNELTTLHNVLRTSAQAPLDTPEEALALLASWSANEPFKRALRFFTQWYAAPTTSAPGVELFTQQISVMLTHLQSTVIEGTISDEQHSLSSPASSITAASLDTTSFHDLME